MNTTYENIGSIGVAHVGQPKYALVAIHEGNYIIKLLQETFGREPQGCVLVKKWFSHDFSQYMEVCLVYEEGNKEAWEYFQKCEDFCLDAFYVEAKEYIEKKMKERDERTTVLGIEKRFEDVKNEHIQNLKNDMEG